ncbi:MAG TPA: GreA/GreB family elongation factor [Flavobacteriaceae bacterium]|nr:GreA/GreB family elongation factor [Flavobacteriaceae bacterium]
MSRGFVKEGDQEEAPIIPPRAELPPGVTNYVTAAGYQALLEEKQTLEKEQKNLPHDNETERRRASMEIDGRLKLLNERIQSARVIDLDNQPRDEVRFGAIVTFKKDKDQLKFQIVGVDEADIKKKKIAFMAPIAKALIGTKKGETAEFKLGKQIEKLKILDISYP